MKLPRPNYTKLDPFFCKKGGFYIFQSKAFFLGSCRSLFWALGGSFLGPWAVCQKGGGGLPKRRGDLKKGFLAEHRLKKRIICTCMHCQCNSLRGGAGQFLSVKKMFYFIIKNVTV